MFGALVGCRDHGASPDQGSEGSPVRIPQMDEARLAPSADGNGPAERLLEVAFTRSPFRQYRLRSPADD